MANFNQITIAGNVTRDPEVTYTQGGKAVCNLSVAINDKRKDQSGQWVENTTFVDVTLWERQAEVAGEYLKKGSSVLIGGKLAMDQWEKDGKKFSKLKVIGQVMQMLGSPGGKGGQRDESSQVSPSADDSPF